MDAAFDAADWDEAGAIHLEHLRTFVVPYRAVIPSGTSVRDAGRLAADPPPALLSAIRESAEVSIDDDEARRAAANVLAGLVVSSAADAGARVTAAPGEPVTIVMDGAGTLNPWAELLAVGDGSDGPTRWEEHPVVVALRDCRL